MMVIQEKNYALAGRDSETKMYVFRNREHGDYLLVNECKYVASDGVVVTCFTRNGSPRLTNASLRKDQGSNQLKGYKWIQFCRKNQNKDWLA